MDVFENFENQLKANPKTIVFTEGTKREFDYRVK